MSKLWHQYNLMLTIMTLSLSLSKLGREIILMEMMPLTWLDLAITLIKEIDWSNHHRDPGNVEIVWNGFCWSRNGSRVCWRHGVTHHQIQGGYYGGHIGRKQLTRNTNHAQILCVAASACLPAKKVPKGSMVLTSTWAMKKKESSMYRVHINAWEYEQVDSVQYDKRL